MAGVQGRNDCNAPRHAYANRKRQQNLLILIVVMTMLTQTITLSSNQIIETKNLMDFSNNLDIPIYDSDGDGVNDENDSHPHDSKLSQHIVGGAPFSDWSAYPAITYQIYPTQQTNHEIPNGMDCLLYTSDAADE